jgi:Flp pilus assembly pilin Flp
MNPSMLERGASSVEYGLLAFAVAAVIAMAVFGLGIATQGLFGQSANAYQSCVQGSC